MILLIDNYDSFSYNLYQLIGSVIQDNKSVKQDIKVIRNDELTINEIEKLNPDAIVISPGPGKPSEAGICIKLVRHFYNKKPLLGICLGHQVIFEAFEGVVSYADKLMHGKQSIINLDNKRILFKGLDQKISVGRYHSLVGLASKLPRQLVITASTENGEIMAIEHENYPVYGLQFHPESILTPKGRKIIENFIEVINYD